jgi:hypothetical protein
MVDRALLSDSLTHAGGGTALAVTYLGVVIPGFFPFLALTVAVTALLILPFVVLGVAAIVIGGPPYGLWRLASRGRRRRRTEPDAPPTVKPTAVPIPHVS